MREAGEGEGDHEVRKGPKVGGRYWFKSYVHI